MTDEEKELAMWRTEWATLGGSVDLVKELSAGVKKGERRRKLAMAGEVLAAACTSTFGVAFAITMKGDPPAVALCAGMFLFNGVMLTRLFTSFRRVDPAASDVAAFVTMTRERHEDALRLLRFSRWSTVVLGIACYAWMAWLMIHIHAPMANPYAITPFVGVTVILAGLFAWYRYARTLLDRRLARFEALIAERTLE